MLRKKACTRDAMIALEPLHECAETCSRSSLSACATSCLLSTEYVFTRCVRRLADVLPTSATARSRRGGFVIENASHDEVSSTAKEPSERNMRPNLRNDVRLNATARVMDGSRSAVTFSFTRRYSRNRLSSGSFCLHYK